MTYTLTLSPNYVIDWGLWEGVREFLQNAIDQPTEMVFDYTGGVLTIGNLNCELSVKTLLLGSSDKGADAIGQFGEGYKLALLALTRGQWGVKILNNDTVWTPRFEYLDMFQSHVLQIDVEPAETPINGVRFVIEGVEQQHYDKIAENYLGEEPLNTILEDEHLRKRVFVGGLFVCRIESLHYGYNFAPGRIKLDRDRRLASTFDITWEASQLWQEEPAEKLNEALKANAPDVQYVQHIPEITRSYIVESYLAQHPTAVPVVTQAEANLHKDTCIVPAPLRNLLHKMHEFCVFKPEELPMKQLEAFHHKYGRQWSNKCTEDWSLLMKRAKLW